MKTEDIYPSRVGQDEKIIPRADPVVYGDVRPKIKHALTTTQLESYQDNGFIVLANYMPEIVAPLLAEIDHLKNVMAGREELITEPNSGELRTIFKPFAFNQRIDQFSRHPKILTIARQLLDSDVYITQSRINIKPAFHGQSFPWHSDFETWHVEDGMPRMRAVTAWIMLNENNEYNGPLYVIPGSHKSFVSCAGVTENNNYNQSLKKQLAGVPQPETMQHLLKNCGIKGIYGTPGTVVFHECNLMHGSPDNISGTPRSLLMLVYNSCENKLVNPFCDQPPRPDYLRNTNETAIEVDDE